MGKTIVLVGGLLDGYTAELEKEEDTSWYCVRSLVKGVDIPLDTPGRAAKVEWLVYDIDPANPGQFNYRGCYPRKPTDH